MTVAAALCQCVSAHIASVGVSLGSIPHIECVSRVNVSRGQCVIPTCFSHVTVTHIQHVSCVNVSIRVCVCVCVCVCVSVCMANVCLFCQCHVSSASLVSLCQKCEYVHINVCLVCYCHTCNVSLVSISHIEYILLSMCLCVCVSVCQCVSLCVKCVWPMCVSDDNVKHATCFSC